jgi:hypothetical protein
LAGDLKSPANSVIHRWFCKRGGSGLFEEAMGQEADTPRYVAGCV